MRPRRALLLLSLPLALASAPPALGLPTGPQLDVWIDGSYAGGYDQTALGCTTSGDVSQCAGSNLGIGLGSGDLLRFDSWNMTFDIDPVVTGITSVTNLAATTQQFTFIFTLPIAPIVPATVRGGSVQGGMTDNDGNDATVSTATGSSYYTALVDGLPAQTLYAHPQAHSAGGAFLSGNIPSVAFGTPIPSQPGGPVLTSIGIKLDFLLTGNDSASFTSNFVVQVPEPHTAALLALGLGAIALLRRR